MSDNGIKQYSNSPILNAIIDSAVNNISPAADIDRIVNFVINIDDAQGFALDILGAWVGIDRSIPDPIAPVYFGFDGATGSEGFDIAPFGY